MFLWSQSGKISRDCSRNIFFWQNLLFWLFLILCINCLPSKITDTKYCSFKTLADFILVTFFGGGVEQGFEVFLESSIVEDTKKMTT